MMAAVVVVTMIIRTIGQLIDVNSHEHCSPKRDAEYGLGDSTLVQ